MTGNHSEKSFLRSRQSTPEPAPCVEERRGLFHAFLPRTLCCEVGVHLGRAERTPQTLNPPPKSTGPRGFILFYFFTEMGRMAGEGKEPPLSGWRCSGEWRWSRGGEAAARALNLISQPQQEDSTANDFLAAPNLALLRPPL